MNILIDEDNYKVEIEHSGETTTYKLIRVTPKEYTQNRKQRLMKRKNTLLEKLAKVDSQLKYL